VEVLRQKATAATIVVSVKKCLFVPISIVVLSALLTACGSSDKSSSSDSNASTTSTEKAGDASGTSAPTKAIASVDGSVKNISLHVDITMLKRSGDLTTLMFTLKNTSADTSRPGFQVGQTFDAATQPAKLGDTLSGIYLVDNVNKKKYTPSIDSAGSCVCSDNLGSVFVPGGSSTTLSATYGAPPATVKNVDVYIPNFGTLSSVPIS
jgi:hypothetical protein